MKKIQAKMFNRKASSSKSKPDKVIEKLKLRPGQKIADIGAGGGYFSLRFADKVGEEGRVYALDTDQDLLDYIEDIALERGSNNIETILVKEDDIDIPDNELDYIFMRNMTHHLSDRVDYFSSLKRFLKPTGTVTIIEYKEGKSFTFRGIFRHCVPKKIIKHEMDEAGYFLEDEFDFLPEQHFTIYSKEDH